MAKESEMKYFAKFYYTSKGAVVIRTEQDGNIQIKANGITCHGVENEKNAVISVLQTFLELPEFELRSILRKVYEDFSKDEEAEELLNRALFGV